MRVRKIIKQRSLLYLMIIYTALEAFRHIGWMLFYEQLIDNTRQEINLGFILYSGAILIVALLAPPVLNYLHIIENRNKIQVAFIISIGFALLFRVLQLFSGMIGAYFFLVLWTIGVMIGICICFIQIFKMVPGSFLGRFFGFALFADALIVSFVEMFTGTIEYFYISIIVAAVLCIVGIVLFIMNVKSNEPEVDEEYSWIPSNYFIKIAMLIFVTYLLIAGIMDNLSFFDDWMDLPSVGSFVLPIMSIMYFVGGIAFDKVKLKITIPIALSLICIAQSMTFFTTEGLFSYSYSIFSNMGSTFLELSVVILPIYYLRMKKKGFCLAALGEGFFYGAFCITSIVFVFVEQAAYRPVMGGILLAVIVCLLLLIDLIILHERDIHKKILDNQKLEMNALKQQVVLTNSAAIEVLPLHEESLNMHFTKREKELMPLIVSSLTAEEIAQQAHLSVSTVRFHIKNILGKSNAKNRRELMRILGEQKLQMNVQEKKK